MTVEIASRKVMVSPEVMEAWAQFRDMDGRPIRIDWGQPDVDGWFNPTITRLECDHAFLREGDYCAACGVGV